LGHSTAETTIRRITGPFAVVGENQFEVRLNRTSSTVDKRGSDLWFAARNPGDGEYVPAVQQAKMVLTEHSGGTPQEIDFAELEDVKSGTDKISLSAKADSGLKVSYYIREGPAEIEGGTLRFTEIPPRSKFPIKVTVVAWQWGNASVNTAKSVERTFSVIQ
jgi:hypothetical protein